MTKEPVEILSDDEGNTKSNNDNGDKRLLYKHKNGVVELHSTSLECLQPRNYLKDNVVQFYFTYLVNELFSSIASRVHIFDSIFYKKIEAAFRDDEKVDRVKLKQLQKWHNGIDIFGKDFLIFPICFEDHWIVVIICYAKAVKPIDSLSDEDEDGDVKMDTSDDLIPGIIFMDSLDLKKGPPLVKISMAIRDFLDFNWRSTTRPVKRFSHSDLADYYPRLPKQKNQYDCGLYMLMYVKSFLEKPDEYYNLVREQGSSQRVESLCRRIEEALETNDRDTIKDLIHKVCSTC